MSELAIKGGPPVVPAGMIQPWPHITAEDKRAVMEALERASPWRHPCEEGTALEQEWAAFVGVRYALACNSGTAALHMGVAACEIGPGDEVLVPADTYLGSASCVLHSNGIPIFVDVRPETDTLDPARIEERINDRTRAIVAVNLHGLPADYDEIHAIAAKHGLLVIEDGAQSHGATYKGRQAGALGHVSGCSINGSKCLSALGEGGLFTTDDERRCALAQHLRMFGEIVDPATPREYDAYMMGWNYRTDPLQAAFARSQLRRLPEMTEVRLRNGAHLTRRLVEIPGVQPPHVPPDRTHTYIQDYDEMFPRGNQDADAATCNAAPGGCWSAGFLFWPQMAQSYIKNFGIMTCPSGESTSRNAAFHGHYGSNRYVMRRRRVVDPMDSATMATLVAPASTYLCFDSGSYSMDARANVLIQGNIVRQSGAFWYIPGSGDATGKPAAAPAMGNAFLQQDYQTGRHFRGIGMAYCDGHVKHVRTTQVLEEAIKAQANQPNAWDPGNPPS